MIVCFFIAAQGLLTADTFPHQHFLPESARSTQAYSKVHNAIHSSATVNEYPQQTPQNPQVPASCPGYISSSNWHWALGIGHWARVCGVKSNVFKIFGRPSSVYVCRHVNFTTIGGGHWVIPTRQRQFNSINMVYRYHTV